MKHLRKFNESLDDNELVDLIKSLELLQKRLEGLNLDLDKIGHLHRYTKETLKGRINAMTKQVERLIDKNLKRTNEEFVDSSEYQSHWMKFSKWLREKDFELYDGYEDLRDKFMKASSNSNLTVEDKATEITNYLDEKWGVYDGYMEIYSYLESLFMDEI